MVSPCATLTVWASSWLAGSAAPDDVLDAMHAWAPMHLVGAGDQVTAGRTGLPWPDAEDAGIMALLKTIREASAGSGAQIQLVLPVAGDVRGLPPGTEFAQTAIRAGDGLIVGVPGRSGTGLVPRRCGQDVLQWTGFSVEVPVAQEQMGLGEAEYAMRTAVRDAADALLLVQRVGSDRDFDPREAVEDELAKSAVHTYPESMPLRARRILQSADHVAAIIAVAQQQPTLLPASMSGAASFDDVLRPLIAAVRSARLVAVQSSVREAARRN